MICQILKTVLERYLTVPEETRGVNSPYKPLEFVKYIYGQVKAAERLLEFVKKYWGYWIQFPNGTKFLVSSGA